MCPGWEGPGCARTPLASARGCPPGSRVPGPSVKVPSLTFRGLAPPAPCDDRVTGSLGATAVRNRSEWPRQPPAGEKHHSSPGKGSGASLPQPEAQQGLPSFKVRVLDSKAKFNFKARKPAVSAAFSQPPFPPTPTVTLRRENTNALLFEERTVASLAFFINYFLARAAPLACAYQMLLM